MLGADVDDTIDHDDEVEFEGLRGDLDDVLATKAGIAGGLADDVALASPVCVPLEVEYDRELVSCGSSGGAKSI